MMKVKSASRMSGFTLIELLIVIIVIAILMGLLFPAFSSIRESARRTAALSDLMVLVHATNAYNTEYGHYPLNPNNMSASIWDQTVYGDPNGYYSSADLCDILRAIPDNRFNTNNVLNSRQVVYLEGHNATGGSPPVSGFVTSQSVGAAGQTLLPGAWVDPWGDEYVTFIDDMNAGNVDQALAWFYWVNTPSVNAGVAGCSLGKDHTWGKSVNGSSNGNFYGSDDVATWQQ